MRKKNFGRAGGPPDDRSSEETARRIVEDLLPSGSFRSFALGIAAEILGMATELGSRSWSVTVFKQRVRLNGSSGWILDIDPGLLGIPVAPDAIPEDVREQLGNRLERGASERDAWVVLEEGDEQLWPLIRDGSERWIRSVATGRARYAQTHSPGFVRYLEAETGQLFDDAWQTEQRPATDGELSELLAFAQSLPDGHYDEWQTKAAEERAEIRRLFPEDAWPNMALEDYAVGQPDRDQVYSTYLEFRSPHLGGVGGGSAIKHGIYFSKSKGAWQFKKKYQDEVEAWRELRQGFVDLFQLADEEQWVEIDETSPIANMMRVKTLVVYRPELVLPIGSRRHLRFFLETLGFKHSEVTGQEALVLNQRLNELLRAQPELDRFNNDALMRLLYDWRHPAEAKRFMKVAPGEDANLWDECLANDMIRVGWPRVGDLKQYETKKELREVFAREHGAEHNNHDSTISRVVNDLWEYRELEPGDRVVANRGTHYVLAVGEVRAPGYEFRDDTEYPHAVHVEWDTSVAKEIPAQAAWRNTIQRRIPVSLQLQILDPETVLPPPPEFERIADALEHKRQVVLFGPPGTGKTYLARRFALWWADSSAQEVAAALHDEERFSSFEAETDARRQSANTWLVVANQTKSEFGWDMLKDEPIEYTEGQIRRNFPMVAVGDLVVGYEAGRGGRIKAIGRVSQPFRETSDGRSFQIEHVLDLPDGPTFQELRDDPIVGSSEGLRTNLRGRLFALSDAEAEALFEMIIERAPKAASVLEREHQAPTITRVTFHPSYAYEDFVEGFRPAATNDGTLRLELEDGVFKRVCREAAVAPEKKFLLLIDEINRGNVAKVFGELITLLERDKRGMVVTLPQSKEPFSVPPNVYILATMNTADRSLRHLDAALRRRFQFIEMLPDTDLLAGYLVRDLPLDEFLDTINAKIVKAFGREKQVGHSFLMSAGAPIVDDDEFAFRFRYEILPLIQEYCYDDFRMLADFFGTALVDVERERFDQEILDDTSRLLDALETHFGTAQRAAE